MDAREKQEGRPAGGRPLRNNAEMETYLPAGGLVVSEPIGEDVVMSVPMLEPVPMSVVPIVVEVSVLVEVDIVVSVVVAGVSSSVSSFLHPANGTSRRASRQRSER